MGIRGIYSETPLKITQPSEVTIDAMLYPIALLKLFMFCFSYFHRYFSHRVLHILEQILIIRSR